MSRWISLNVLSDETGLAVRTLQYIRAQEPAVLTTRKKGSGLEYKQPDCSIALRAREVAKALKEHEPAVDLDTARTRKALAEAELAEIEVAKARGEVVALSDYEAALSRILDRLTARLRAMPVRLAHLGETVEDETEQEVEKILIELNAWDHDVIDDEMDEPARAA